MALVQYTPLTFDVDSSIKEVSLLFFTEDPNSNKLNFLKEIRVKASN